MRPSLGVSDAIGAASAERSGPTVAEAPIGPIGRSIGPARRHDAPKASWTEAKPELWLEVQALLRTLRWGP
ncbi:MAG TPA: hypothetical protein VGF51_06945 [Acidimicrobiales bacterium]